ncbi:MAG: dUTP diphosphatase [Flavobacteriia bacterium]|jgi:dUTP pyrophosphatase|nr:dUTP diphosphatase [Flavobacteriia bacterium]
MFVKITNKSKHPLPKYETLGASGMDIRANTETTIVIQPLDRVLIKTGLFLEMENGLECQVRPRSGLALKKGLSVLNTPGTIDADYRGEIGVILVNLSNLEVSIEDGERIAQLVFCKVEHVSLTEVAVLNDSERGVGGFGSTGLN